MPSVISPSSVPPFEWTAEKNDGKRMRGGMANKLVKALRAL